MKSIELPEKIMRQSRHVFERLMLEAWRSMHPEARNVAKYLRHEHIDGRDYLNKTETFERCYENPIDLSGRWCVQAVHELFQENRLAKGEFVGLGRRLSLAGIRCPVNLLAGEADDITTREQVFAAGHLVGTPRGNIVRALAPGGHMGLFMGAKTLRGNWTVITRWIVSEEKS